MAAPAIPPIRPGLIGTGLAVERLHRPASRRHADALAAGYPDRTFVVGENGEVDELRAAAVVDTAEDGRVGGGVGAAARHAALRLGSGGHEHALAAVQPAVQPRAVQPRAVRFGVRPVGGVARSAANEIVVQRALDSAQRVAALALDPVPGAGPVPLWRHRGSTGLFDGLPGQRFSSSASLAA